MKRCLHNLAASIGVGLGLTLTLIATVPGRNIAVAIPKKHDIWAAYFQLKRICSCES
jgi:hypothetical protein